MPFCDLGCGEYTTQTKKIKVQKLTDFVMRKHITVKVSKQGRRYAETVYCERNTLSTVRKYSKTEYVDLRTGEIRLYKVRDSKYDESLRKTFRRLQALIRTNFDADGNNQLFLTLTYRDRQIPQGRLYADYKDFIARLRRHYKQHKLDYIAVAEPQDDGTWHMHVLLKSNQESLYIKYDVLERIWGQGYVTVEQLKSDDVGAYYVTYFTDILGGDEGDNSKKRQKGERLKYYPKDFKFYRTSRGIKQPDIVDMPYESVTADYGKPVYEAAYAICDEVDQVVNRIHKAAFKRKN